ncbi:MAG: respiratory nitrate reductase subunit gamma [Euryarchaeota archaeon]|nr:respiratory nitrate reductase subunit gamma [Euryarchaeota archaeon]MBU4340286.1 respiratory nitrate reductase subunit gamma [Euryarchaeota archaeon]MBU4453573.1 respiratory nitrate reductase subunit gamma [Euryarchaeota archaeon]MCG2737052.1 disulfide reductase [Candidatus Methanoperedenaceae archaeon]
MTDGLEIFGKTIWDTVYMDYRIIAVVAIISIILFLVGMYIQLSKWGRGIPEGATKPIGASGALKMIISKTFENGIGPALEILILDVLFQRRIFRRRKLEWFMHICIFWGWIGLLILTIVAAASEFYGPFVLGVGPEFFIGMSKFLELPNDIFGYMLVLGIVIAIARRLFSTGKDVKARNADVDWILIIGLVIVVATGFYAQYLRTEVYDVVSRGLISDYPAGFFNNSIVMFHEVFTMLFCIAYLPFSKYFHMIAAPLTILVNKGGE